MMKNDAFGDRMKAYEKNAAQRFLPLIPICARLDGKGFSKFTKGLKRPYDPNMTTLMQHVTHYLVEETGALIGYTQSDEISLVWYTDSTKKQVFFDGKIQKMVSVLASMATAKFNSLVPELLPSKEGTLALFDCRVWQVPTKIEAVNMFLWREQDATKNSISMAASEYYSHKQLHKCNGAQKQEMLFKKGINWNAYPSYFKRGSYFQRSRKETAFTIDEIAKLPPQHQAHTEPDLKVSRSVVEWIDAMPPLYQVVNKVAVIFDGANPQTLSETLSEVDND